MTETNGGSVNESAHLTMLPTSEYTMRHAANFLAAMARNSSLRLATDDIETIDFAYQQLLRGANMIHGTEWACQWKTFRDGDYDRMMSHHPLSNKPLTEDEAREEVQNMLAANIPARLLYRRVSEWIPDAR